ncbi:MAG: hypothetical protein EWV75_12890 [Microcystis wesenbergii Mw_QC_S_20081001_S30D]|jgi:hypothetical protein|uniref:Uncharacterized protein n=1 Tax=Microcystis wesenbergii Mw_QC_S_20081001_S30D TaxID=2486245 RepID=A0A552JJ79_9CHRO|nr:hypothetical protein [Microcystis aeruginosa W11-03]NCR96073.1 hypothetical protein [Microcystis aeruginosa W11-06]TRU95816.1 MAG: hypothetical protein EWV75_12890 [Microcystis wesenbergii Mw_QC_S_20081001_S30D]TRV00362.1 MAG: hypothetical protein EWV73_11385 [Microcystis wesenbergii Mw_QC_B_20070930_S4D]TRV03327.1 MAG: hypothetical protein EWV74_07140 [Microcystis wesenbergii Mw_QC_S_20081001_S30]TRV07520.1 MAG: hypothetical protein EWV89_22250 [Microcystis wesenbergii Mw_QC_B_20070930_S4]
MSQAAAAINTKLIDSLAQIILSLTDEEQQLLLQKIQHPALAAEEIQRQREVLKRDIELGIEQLRQGDYTEYDESSLPSLLETIKMLAKQRLQEELI